MPNPYVTLVESWKDFPAGQGWSPPDAIDNVLSLYVPLSIGGVTVGSFALRGTCYADQPDRAVMFQLETGLHGQRTRLPLARIDWRPISGGHKNPSKGVSRKGSFIVGSHLHPLHSNWIEALGRMRESNLPVAEALPSEPANYWELLDLVRILFRINGIDALPEPEWAPKLM